MTIFFEQAQKTNFEKLEKLLSFFGGRSLQTQTFFRHITALKEAYVWISVPVRSGGICAVDILPNRPDTEKKLK